MSRVKKYKYLLPLLLIIIFTSCSSKKDKPELPDIQVSKDEVIDKELLGKQINSAKQIFYSLPSPLETAMILKRSGASYNSEILNPTENNSKYITNKSKALNLGIYSTDLSYASLYDQTQVTIKYMSVAKSLAEGLGVLNAIDDETITRLQDNINNREIILDIISETLLNTNSYLDEDNRTSIASIIMLGGWIEGLYIASNLVEPENLDQELVLRICDQKLTLETIINLLSISKDDSDVAELIADIESLKEVYESISIKTSGVTSVVNNSETNTSKIMSKNKLKVNQTEFDNIVLKIRELRTKYTR